MVNVDLFISDDQGRVLLTWRDDEIFGAGWHIPGGMIRYKETAGRASRPTIAESTGHAGQSAYRDTPS
jgi:colanic acid biosynthesis protein WcaH